MQYRRGALALIAVSLISAGPVAAKPILAMPPLFQSRPASPPPSLVFAYHGWRIDASHTGRAQPAARTVRAIRAQIDLVEHLGLRPDMLAFMRNQPILADAAPAPTAADYVPGRGVVLHVRRLDPKKPILLYGLLKAYMAQRLPGGFANPDVERLRTMAAGRRVWPKTALMLQGGDEFFALSASAYLAGAITREPYTRADLKKTEPMTYQWLAALFDGGRPRG
jgi:hypothetical protein